MTEKDLIPGTVVRHFKRDMLTDEQRAESTRYLYEILAVATHTESGERLVIYRALYGEGAVCARPIDMFLSPTDTAKYPEAQQKFRFERVK